MLAGMLAGLVTGLFHTRCGIPAILAGILSGVLTTLCSVLALSLAFRLSHEEYVTLLPKSNRLFLSKSKFMDSYVVFVENDGSGLYHKYGCDDFAQTSFWAYSRKLAEANGYKPCPRCFG